MTRSGVNCSLRYAQVHRQTSKGLLIWLVVFLAYFRKLDFSIFEKKRKTFQRETAEKMCLFWMMRSGNHALFILDEINRYWYPSFTVHIS